MSEEGEFVACGVKDARFELSSERQEETSRYKEVDKIRLWKRESGDQVAVRVAGG